MELKAALPVLKPAIYECWSQIGHDVLQCAEECGEDVDNVMALEACLDADRLLLVCNNRAAYDLYKTLIKEHGWHKTVEFLARSISLN